MRSRALLFERVQHANAFAGGDEAVDEMGADEASPACNEHR